MEARLRGGIAQAFECVLSVRNRLNMSTLDSLLHISVEGPELNDFRFESAAMCWASQRNRRLKV